jgi:hypothetical protein
MLQQIMSSFPSLVTDIHPAGPRGPFICFASPLRNLSTTVDPTPPFERAALPTTSLSGDASRRLTKVLRVHSHGARYASRYGKRCPIDTHRIFSARVLAAYGRAWPRVAARSPLFRTCARLRALVHALGARPRPAPLPPRRALTDLLTHRIRPALRFLPMRNQNCNIFALGQCPLSMSLHKRTRAINLIAKYFR